MPSSCCVYGCTNKHNKLSSVKFYRFPTGHKDYKRSQREKWINAIGRVNEDGSIWRPNKGQRVCSEHFITGQPRGERDHPDYVPSIFAYKKDNNGVQNLQRFERRQCQRKSPSVSTLQECVPDGAENVTLQSGYTENEKGAAEILLLMSKAVENETGSSCNDGNAAENMASSKKVALGCSNHFSKETPGITFHRFPVKEEERETRVNATRRINWKPAKYSRLCSKQFTDECFYRMSPYRVFLNEKVVPTVSKAFSPYLQAEFVSTLPTNLCLKQSNLPNRRFKVLSLEAIPIGVRFGPYQEKFTDSSKHEEKDDSQQQVEHKENDSKKEREANWLQYVNYACHKEQWNMIAFRIDSELYYITCRSIPANTELLVYATDNKLQNRRGCEKDITISTEREELFGKKYVDRSNPLVHEQVHSVKKLFKCKVCRKNFTTRRTLLVHERIHTGKNLHKCSVCGKKFTTRSYLVVHETLHTGTKPFQCNICGSRFTTRSSLTLHGKRSHTGEKPFGCSICGKKFTTRSDLIVHERTHTGEKPFKCNICRKQYPYRSSLTVHERRHTETKHFECNICGKKCLNRSNLIVHERIHAGKKVFECNVCGKMVISKSSLIVHERIHTGEKPFECNVCVKKFTNRSNLIVHERIHFGKKLFECDDCGKMFTTSRRLTLHEKNSHCQILL